MGADLIGPFREVPFAAARTATTDTLRMAERRHHIPVIGEVDVTAAREAIGRAKREGKGDLSFTAWAVSCVARAAGEHRRVHAVRRGRRRLVLFEDVDVALAVFRRLTPTDGGDTGERLPMPFVVRRAQDKSVAALSAEIGAARAAPLAPGEQWLDPHGTVPPPRLLRLAFAAPFALRRWFYWDRLLADPWRVKRTMGTVMVTSVPLTSRSGGGVWAVTGGIHPLVVVLGAVGRRPACVGDEIVPREVLSMTVLFDHDVVDGVPVALFLRRLAELMEGAAGL
jgi:pyruvate/2-oxoglutarate dehydrogenase complex dihydrolipoamide acyltransferase (E2) component